MDEFDLIKRYFSAYVNDPAVLLGIGDDAALVKADSNQALAICVDTLIEAIHFPKETNPADIAYKAVAVNLSDLAAMGAEPKWITLALTMPEVNQDWLQQFSQGLAEICQKYQVALIGGDTTRGSLSITVQAHGVVPESQALMRSGAQVGDKLFVTKPLGAAALGLQVIQGKLLIENSQQCLEALNRPQPAIKQGLILREYASSCIDISDGFLADLQHVLTASGVGANIDLNNIPLPEVMVDRNKLMQAALTGGDDYVLCFTVAPENILTMQKAFSANKLACYAIGEITEQQQTLILLHQESYRLDLSQLGFLHF